MTQTYTFDIERVRLEDCHLTVSALAATLEEDVEDFEVTVPVGEAGDGAFRPELGDVLALDLETLCEGIGIADGQEVARSQASNGFSIWKDAGYPEDLDANGTFGFIIERRVL
jgi:hypothetical protein